MKVFLTLCMLLFASCSWGQSELVFGLGGAYDFAKVDYKNIENFGTSIHKPETEFTLGLNLLLRIRTNRKLGFRTNFYFTNMQVLLPHEIKDVFSDRILTTAIHHEFRSASLSFLIDYSLKETEFYRVNLIYGIYASFNQ